MYDANLNLLTWSRALYHALVILLHRPLLSYDRLRSASPQAVYESFVTCASAAIGVTRILHAYEKAYAVGSAPYLMSYATYISATIHVRVVGQSTSSSEAYEALKTCLDTLDEHQHVYSAARRAKQAIHALMGRMGVTVNDQELSPQRSRVSTSQDISLTHDQTGVVPHGAATWKGGRLRGSDQLPDFAPPAKNLDDFDFPGFDIDAVVQSFFLEQQMAEQPFYIQ